MKFSLIIRPVSVLAVICLSVALLLSAVNLVTAPQIERNQADKANAALLEVLPEGKNFKKLTLNENYPPVVTDGYSADGGFVFQMTVSGYKPGLVIMCGVSTDGKIVGVKHIATNETYGYEEELNGVYIGADKDSLEMVIATGATPKSNTSTAYYNAVNAALKAYIVANGGTVDNRSPYQILQDNCNAALGTTGASFSRFFESWSQFGDAAVYLSDAGVVVSVGESFVGYGSDNTPIGEHAEEVLTAANAAYEAYASLEKLDISVLNSTARETVLSVYKNTSGDHMFTLSAWGFDYATDPIIIELIIDQNGAIASCVTVSHSESGGYGAPCGTPEYYEQYLGKNENTYDEVPNITATDSNATGVNGGATQTSSGYKYAISTAFSAFNKLTATEEGGNG